MPAPVRSPLPCKTMNFNGLLNNQLFPALCCLHHEQQCLHAKATKAKQTVASTRYLCTAAQHTVYCCTPHNPAYSNPYSECIKSTSPKDLTLLTAYMTETSTRSPPQQPRYKPYTKNSYLPSHILQPHQQRLCKPAKHRDTLSRPATVLTVPFLRELHIANSPTLEAL